MSIYIIYIIYVYNMCFLLLHDSPSEIPRFLQLLGWIDPGKTPGILETVQKSRLK